MNALFAILALPRRSIFTAFALLVVGTCIRGALAQLPHSSTGALGPLTYLGNEQIVFYTDTGLYSVNGVFQNDVNNRRSVEIFNPAMPDYLAGMGNAFLAAYDFTNINLGPGVIATVDGQSPLLLLSQDAIMLAGIIDVHGASGNAGARRGGRRRRGRRCRRLVRDQRCSSFGFNSRSWWQWRWINARWQHDGRSGRNRQFW